MTIDPNFEENREHEGQEHDGDVGAADAQFLRRVGRPPDVDFDICIADGACLEDCPVDVFEWVDTPDHPESEIKANPTSEDQCIDCMLCVDVCPVDAVDVDPGRAGRI